MTHLNSNWKGFGTHFQVNGNSYLLCCLSGHFVCVRHFLAIEKKKNIELVCDCCCSKAHTLYNYTTTPHTMRQLKYHEKKLLRKVSLYSWKGEDNLRVAKILRRYHIQNREDYVAYTRICGMVTKLTAKLKVSVQYQKKKKQVMRKKE